MTEFIDTSPRIPFVPASINTSKFLVKNEPRKKPDSILSFANWSDDDLDGIRPSILKSIQNDPGAYVYGETNGPAPGEEEEFLVTAGFSKEDAARLAKVPLRPDQMPLPPSAWSRRHYRQKAC